MYVFAEDFFPSEQFSISSAEMSGCMRQATLEMYISCEILINLLIIFYIITFSLLFILISPQVIAIWMSYTFVILDTITKGLT